MRVGPVNPPTLETAERVDALCDVFEEAWVEGRRPRIEDFLGDTAEPDRSTLLFELVAIEVHHRRQQGEQPSIDEYASRFPEHTALLSNPSLSLREDVALAAEATVSYREERHASVAQFELLQRLGTGNYGTVWRARDTKLDRIVALKVPRKDQLDPQEIEKFLREARAAAQLRHPQIVGVYEVGHNERSAWIAAEYIEGVSLKDWLTAHRMAPREAAAFCIQLAGALQHAHDSGVIHRDLKPGNVILDCAGRPHVTDFGLAKRLSGEATLTTEGQVMGTPAYMSPEQAQGRGHQVDARSDVYSLGVVLYELLCGERPFQGSQDMVLYQVLFQDPPSLRPRSDVPRDLETICLKAMAKEPSRRYASAAEFAADLQRFLDGRPIVARPVGRVEKLWHFARRHAAAISIGLVACLATAAVVLLSLGWPPRRASAPPAEVQQASAHRTVEVVTEPAGARVVLVPLGKDDGEPAPDRAFRPSDGERTPLRLTVPPGHYLVVAQVEGHGFHEVYRIVPDEPDEDGTTHYPLFDIRPLDDGALALSPIRIPPEAEASAGMVRFDGGTFLMGSLELPEAPAHERDVLPFLYERREVTTAEFERVMGYLPEGNEGKPSDAAVTFVSQREAAQYAERLGRRLPTEEEYEFAATAGGTRRFPWGDDLPAEPWSFGPVGTPALDRTATDPPIYGLYSNVAEWTSSWQNPYPTLRPTPGGLVPPPPLLPPLLAEHRESRVVRGGTGSVIDGQPDPEDYLRGGPRRRQAWYVTMRLPQVGFRCARSIEPRYLVP